MRSTRGALVGVLLLLMSLVTVGSASSAVALPGGKANWTVAVGGLTNGTAHKNWVRLGYYRFNTNGTVAHDWWNWSQPERPRRVGTGVVYNCTTSTDVPPDCNILTGAGFTTAPPGGFTGTFSVSGAKMTVSWTHDRAGNKLTKTLVENWTTGAVDAELHRASGGPTGFSNYSATHGFAYGSNYAIDSASRASMAEIRGTGAQDGNLGFNSWGWNRSQVTNGRSGFTPLTGWRLCDSGKCLGYVQPNSNCVCAGEPSRDRHYYFAEHGTGRVNSMWLWCECLADARDETCYTGNSHPRPLLQVIDDGGDFRGWVGVEPFTNASAPGDYYNEYWAVFEFTDAV